VFHSLASFVLVLFHCQLFFNPPFFAHSFSLYPPSIPSRQGKSTLLSHPSRYSIVDFTFYATGRKARGPMIDSCGAFSSFQHTFIHFNLTIAQRSLSCRQINNNLLSITSSSVTALQVLSALQTPCCSFSSIKSR
jgi:hypothetical protein